jgi:NCS1 family nucleobase:cation symporter-1
LTALSHREGANYYNKGINPRAMIALAAGVGLALIGLAYTPLHFLYDYAWFVGFFTAGLIYMALMKVAVPAVYAAPALEAVSKE